MPRDFMKIKAWQFADELCFQIYGSTRAFPDDERYGLTSQIRRSSVSVAANIAEGADRQTKKDYLHFLYIARGSLSETRYHLHLCRRLRYLSDAEYSELDSLRAEAASTLQGLIRSVQKEAGVYSRLLAFWSSAAALYGAGRFLGL